MFNLKDTDKTIILGSGPAGLAAADELSSYGMRCEVIEKHGQVGGLCRTINYEGFLFDIGGHRFLSKSTEVNAIWKSVLGSELLERERKSRIFYGGGFYDYPLRPWKALTQMGPLEASRCMLSYAGAQVYSGHDTSTFEGWMTRRFGRRLFETFFKSYTEKVWGTPCNLLSSDWAEQRIQELSLLKAIGRGLLPQNATDIKTLSDRFLYPRKGPGQFCELMRERCEQRGVDFRLNRRVTKIAHDGKNITRVCTDDGNVTAAREGEYFISTIPLSMLVQLLDPAPPENILKVARELCFRSFMSVNLIFRKKFIFDDHWIYVHSPDMHVGRIQNYKNWSPDMVPDPEMTSLGMEYFVSRGDALWNMSDSDLLNFAVDEAERLGFGAKQCFVKGCVVRVAHAYPVYSPGYEARVDQVRSYLERFTNLQEAGRAGLFRYNNSDHAILTGLYAARNIFGEKHDLWSVDPDRSLAASGV